MDGKTALFWVLSGVALVSAMQLILAKNAVKAVLSLVLSFFSTAGLWLLLEMEFLAMSLVLVYVGAVMVLFLFVVMMIDVETESLKSGFTRHLPLGACLSVLLVVGLVYALSAPQFPAANIALSALPSTPLVGSQVKALGEVLYTQFLYPLEIIGLLLLVAMVAAISLTFKGRRAGNKAVPAHEQVRVQKKARLSLVKGLQP